MADDTWWQSTRGDLLLLVERLTAEDALQVVQELVKHESQDDAIAAAAGVLRALVWLHDAESTPSGQHTEWSEAAMKCTNLSDEATITLNDDGSAIIEVLHGEDVAMIALSSAEVEQLRAFLCEIAPASA